MLFYVSVGWAFMSNFNSKSYLYTYILVYVLIWKVPPFLHIQQPCAAGKWKP